MGFLINLKPCPFCGEQPVQYVYPTCAGIECKGCNFSLSGFGPESPENGANGIYWTIIEERWNARPGEDRISERKNKLESALYDVMWCAKGWDIASYQCAQLDEAYKVLNEQE
jgi:hypothetical protein